MRANPKGTHSGKYIFILFAFCIIWGNGYAQSFAKTYTLFRTGYYGVSVLPTDSEQTAVLGYVPFTIIVDSIGNAKYTNSNYPYVGYPNASNITKIPNGYAFFMSYGWGNMGNPNAQNLIFINDTLKSINSDNFFTGLYAFTNYINLYNVSGNGVFFSCTCWTHSSAFPYTRYPTTFISRFDSVGNLIWNDDFGPNYVAIIYNSIITSDSSMAIVGTANDTILQLDKIDFNNNLIFTHAYTILDKAPSLLIETNYNILSFGNSTDTLTNKGILALEIITLNDSLIVAKNFTIHSDTVNVTPIAVYPESDTSVVLNYTISGSTLNYYLIVDYKGDSLGSFTLPAYSFGTSENGNILSELDTNNEILVREYTPQERLVYQYVYPFGTSNTCHDIKSLPYPGGFVLTGTSNSDLLIIRQDTTYINPKITSVVNNVCNGSYNGSASISVAGGITPYTYSWNPYGGTTEIASGLSAGNYTITVTDNKGNSNNNIIAITQPPLLNSVITTTNSNCTNSTGMIKDSAFGGIKPYSYLWSNGRTNDTLLNLSSGSYICTIKDSNGCSKMDRVYLEKGPTANISFSNLSCYNANAGSASVYITGNYSYAWSPVGGTDSVATGLSAGTYTVVLTNIDTAGCNQIYSVTITQPAPITATYTVVNTLCNPSQTINALATGGGTPPYTYVWSYFREIGTSVNINVSCLTGTTTDTLYVTDSKGCTNHEIVNLISPLTWTGTGQTNISCYNGNNGTIGMHVCGGNPPYTYYWNLGSYVSYNPSYSVSNLTAGSYTVTVSDTNGCNIGYVNINITQPPALSIITDSINDNGTCNGSAWVQVSGGTPSYSYLWTGGLTADTISNQCNGDYCCTVMDANGCIDSTCITINLLTGTNKLEIDNRQLTIFPNPNEGGVTLEMKNEKLIMKNIEVFNVLGEQIYSQLNIINSELNIDLATQPNGIYLYRVISDNGNLLGQGKFVIQH